MPYAFLPDRAVLSVGGADARTFLQNLVTCDVEALQPGGATFGALLTPQGKILFDLFVVAVPDDEFWLETASDNAPALAKRLAMYKLRANVAIASTPKQVVAVWGNTVAPHGHVFSDPRAEDLGRRVIVDIVDDPGDPAAYTKHRISLGIPQGGVDFAWGEAFPHDVNMDVLHGVSFTKGCYVGQEVVSRMQHRGAARRRIVRATFDGVAPEKGAEIRAGDTLLGTFGSSVDGAGLAEIRQDRLSETQALGLVARAGETVLHLARPA